MNCLIKIRHAVNIYRSLVFTFFLRLKYPKKLSMDIRQVFEKRVDIKIDNLGSICIAKNLHARKNVTIHSAGGRIKIGKCVFLNNNVCITAMDSISIGEGTTIANNVVIVDHDHDYLNKGCFKSSPIFIGKNVWIGANCVILRGTVIGDNCVIGAGSVIKGIIPNNTLNYTDRRIVTKEIAQEAISNE